MNLKWKEKVYDTELGGWVTIPNYLAHNYKALGLNAEMAMFIIDILTNSEDFSLHDEYMATHAETRTLRRFRARLKKLGYMEWQGYSKRSSDGTYKHTGFKYNLDGLLNKIIEKVALAKNGHTTAINGQPSASKCTPTKESDPKESDPKESFNNIPNVLSGTSPDKTSGVENLNRTTSKTESILESDPIDIDIDTIDAYMDRFLSEPDAEYFNRLEAEDEETTIYWHNGEPSFDNIESHASEKDVQLFIKLYTKARRESGLPELKNIGAHIKNIRAAPAYIIKEYIDYPYLFGWFFRYCRDRGYNMNIRHYECNSKFEPSIVVNESIDRRFSAWYKERRANIEEVLIQEEV